MQVLKRRCAMGTNPNFPIPLTIIDILKSALNPAQSSLNPTSRPSTLLSLPSTLL